jgi:hypothetical protein
MQINAKSGDASARILEVQIFTRVPVAVMLMTLMGHVLCRVDAQFRYDLLNGPWNFREVGNSKRLDLKTLENVRREVYLLQ